MADPQPSAPDVGRAFVAALAFVALICLGVSLFLPVTIDRPREGGEPSWKTVGSIWQEAVDHTFTDGGGLASAVWALPLLVLFLSTLVVMFLCALLLGGPVGPTGARIAYVASLVVLLGAVTLLLVAFRLAEATSEWLEGYARVTSSPLGGTMLFVGAVAFAALTVPPAVRALWVETDEPRTPAAEGGRAGPRRRVARVG